MLFLALHEGRAANKFGLLTGQIVAVDMVQMTWLISTCAVVLMGLCVLWRPLTFASLDPEVAAARGVPVRAPPSLFMVLLGLSVAVSIQVVGALLVLALLVTPAAGPCGSAPHRAWSRRSVSCANSSGSRDEPT